MAVLRHEYTDVKHVKHHVEHLTLPAEDSASQERIIEELLCILTRPSKQIRA